MAIHPPLNDAIPAISPKKLTQSSFLNSPFSSDLKWELVSRHPWSASDVLPMHCQRKVSNIPNQLVPDRILSLPHLLSKPLCLLAGPLHRSVCEIPLECTLPSFDQFPVLLQVHELQHHVCPPRSAAPPRVRGLLRW